MVTFCLPPHLNPRTRRRRMFAIVLVVIFGTLYLCYAKFDQMAQTAKTIMPLKTFEGSESSSSESKQQEGGKTETTFADLAAAQKPMPPMSYGTYARPPLKDLVTLSTLPADKLPTSAPSSHRLIVIGDVHGQLNELKALLEKVEYSKERGDHIIFTGDLINKGVDSPGVVQLAMDLGASSVRGNHEDRILLAWDNENARNVLGSKGADKGGKIADLKGLSPEPVDDMAEPALAGQSGTQSVEVQVARSLSHKQRDWLSNLPVILKVGSIPAYGTVVVVHAGLVPDVPIESQDPWAVMHMRTLVYPAEQVRRERIKKMIEDIKSEKAGKHVSASDEEVERELQNSRDRGEGTADHNVALPTEGRDGKQWSEAWDENQSKLNDDIEKTTVVYGHDAKRGLYVGKFAFGLDSSCVKGGQLTAMVFEPQNGKVGHRFVSVECQMAPGEKAKADQEKRRKKRGDNDGLQK